MYVSNSIMEVISKIDEGVGDDRERRERNLNFKLIKFPFNQYNHDKVVKVR